MNRTVYGCIVYNTYARRYMCTVQCTHKYSRTYYEICVARIIYRLQFKCTITLIDTANSSLYTFMYPCLMKRRCNGFYIFLLFALCFCQLLIFFFFLVADFCIKTESIA